MPKAAIIGFVAVVVAVVIFVVMGQKRSFEPVKAGTDSINFTLPDLNGKPVSLKDYRGKVVFLNFWATWCQPCKDEMPSMQALYESLKGTPFEILAVSVDKDGPEVVSEFVKKYKITFPVLHDRKGSMKETYKTTGVPETFIIDQNGVIAEKVWGPREWADQSSTVMIMDLIKNGPKKPEAYRTSKE
ncbi:MAG: TlpA family protein disulfide reductase [Deltaproteobacteria bacterium]|nr:TlpA family protein disulfide reductase [Deltaproteobacteria bacterium]